MGIPEDEMDYGVNNLDGVNLRDYGVIAVRGSYNDFLKMPDLKDPSSYAWDGEDGEDVDLRSRTVAARDISMTFLMSAESIPALMANRNNLFVALRAEGWRYLYIALFSSNFKLFFKSCESAKFINGSKKRIELVLKFRLDFSESPTGDIEVDIR